MLSSCSAALRPGARIAGGPTFAVHVRRAGRHAVQRGRRSALRSRCIAELNRDDLAFVDPRRRLQERLERVQRRAVPRSAGNGSRCRTIRFVLRPGRQRLGRLLARAGGRAISRSSAWPAARAVLLAAAAASVSAPSSSSSSRKRRAAALSRARCAGSIRECCFSRSTSRAATTTSSRDRAEFAARDAAAARLDRANAFASRARGSCRGSSSRMQANPWAAGRPAPSRLRAAARDADHGNARFSRRSAADPRRHAPLPRRPAAHRSRHPAGIVNFTRIEVFGSPSVNWVRVERSPEDRRAGAGRAELHGRVNAGDHASSTRTSTHAPFSDVSVRPVHVAVAHLFARSPRAPP